MDWAALRFRKFFKKRLTRHAMGILGVYVGVLLLAAIFDLLYMFSKPKN